MNAKNVTAETEFLKVFSVGDPGTGKSIFASSFPTPGYVFDFAQSIISYRGLDFDYDQFSLNAAGWVAFEKTLKRIKEETSAGKYQSIIVDDLSSMTDLCMERAMQLDPKRSPTNGPLWNVHYQMVRNLMEGRLRQLLNLPCNLCFIGHLDETKDEKTGAILGVKPMLTGQLSVKMPGYFDEVYYHTVRRTGKETKWLIQTVPFGFNRARSRLSGKERLLPDLLENSYDEVMSYITKKKKKGEKK